MATFTNSTPPTASVGGQNNNPNSEGDIWSLELKGVMPDNVSSSTKFIYRQAGLFGENDDPAADLLAAFATVGGNPMDMWLSLVSDQFQFECAVIRNISVSKSFTNVFALDGAAGTVLGELNSPLTTVNLRMMGVNGDLGARKTLYLPGIAQSNITDSKITQDAQMGFDAFVNSLYTINGPVGEWQWSMGPMLNIDTQDVAGAHNACFIGRQKDRSAASC